MSTFRQHLHRINYMLHETVTLCTLTYLKIHRVSCDLKIHRVACSVYLKDTGAEHTCGDEAHLVPGPLPQPPAPVRLCDRQQCIAPGDVPIHGIRMPFVAYIEERLLKRVPPSSWICIHTHCVQRGVRIHYPPSSRPAPASPPRPPPAPPRSRRTPCGGSYHKV